MEQIVELALIGKVILSYKFGSLSSFHDQFERGVWKRSSNGCFYPLDNRLEQLLYVEINENHEANTRNSWEKLQSFKAAHQVFDEMSHQASCSNLVECVGLNDEETQIPPVAKSSYFPDHDDGGTKSIETVAASNEFQMALTTDEDIHRKNDLHGENNDDVSALEDDYNIMCQSNEVLSGASEDVEIGILKPPIYSISSENVEVVFAGNMSSNSPVLLAEDHTNLVCGIGELQVWSYENVEQRIDCSSVVEGQAPIVDTFVEEHELDPIEQTVDQIEDIAFANSVESEYEVPSCIVCEAHDESFELRRQMATKLSGLDNSNFRKLVIVCAGIERFSTLRSTLLDGYQTFECEHKPTFGITYEEYNSSLSYCTPQVKQVCKYFGDDNNFTLCKLGLICKFCGTRVLKPVICSVTLEDKGDFRGGEGDTSTRDTWELIVDGVSYHNCPLSRINDSMVNLNYTFDPGGIIWDWYEDMIIWSDYAFRQTNLNAFLDNNCHQSGECHEIDTQMKVFDPGLTSMNKGGLFWYVHFEDQHPIANVFCLECASVRIFDPGGNNELLGALAFMSSMVDITESYGAYSEGRRTYCVFKGFMGIHLEKTCKATESFYPNKYVMELCNSLCSGNYLAVLWGNGVKDHGIFFAFDPGGSDDFLRLIRAGLDMNRGGLLVVASLTDFIGRCLKIKDTMVFRLHRHPHLVACLPVLLLPATITPTTQVPRVLVAPQPASATLFPWPSCALFFASDQMKRVSVDGSKSSSTFVFDPGGRLHFSSTLPMANMILEDKDLFERWVLIHIKIKWKGSLVILSFISSCPRL